MIVLISPAKSMDFERKIPELNFTNPVFHGDAVKLVKTITPLGEKGLQDLMKLSKKLSELNNNRFLEFEMRPKNSRARPAIFSFNGDVYDGINIDSFTIEDIYYAQRNLRILSGLYGLLKPLDLIQPHRLEMGTKLKNAKGNNLYDWWHSRIAQELKKEIVNGKSEALINLASLEYFKSVEKYINDRLY